MFNNYVKIEYFNIKNYVIAFSCLKVKKHCVVISCYQLIFTWLLILKYLLSIIHCFFKNFLAICCNFLGYAYYILSLYLYRAAMLLLQYSLIR